MTDFSNGVGLARGFAKARLSQTLFSHHRMLERFMRYLVLLLPSLSKLGEVASCGGTFDMKSCARAMSLRNHAQARRVMRTVKVSHGLSPLLHLLLARQLLYLFLV
jgi:hypothetical protein